MQRQVPRVEHGGVEAADRVVDGERQRWHRAARKRGLYWRAKRREVWPETDERVFDNRSVIVEDKRQIDRIRKGDQAGHDQPDPKPPKAVQLGDLRVLMWPRGVRGAAPLC